MRKLSLTSFTVSAIHALRVLISCVVRFVSVRPRVILWKSVFFLCFADRASQCIYLSN